MSEVDLATEGVVLEVLERLWRGLREFDFAFLAFSEATFLERAGKPLKLAQDSFKDLEAGFAVALADLDSDCGTAEGSIMPLAVVFPERTPKLVLLVKRLGRERRHGAASFPSSLRQLGMIFGGAYLLVCDSGRGASVECRSMEVRSQGANLLLKLCVALGCT